MLELTDKVVTLVSRLSDKITTEVKERMKRMPVPAIGRVLGRHPRTLTRPTQGSGSPRRINGHQMNMSSSTAHFLDGQNMTTTSHVLCGHILHVALHPSSSSPHANYELSSVGFNVFRNQSFVLLDDDTAYTATSAPREIRRPECWDLKRSASEDPSGETIADQAFLAQ